jgi:glycosyltransferase involved in cell wall biosynthesis
LSAKFENFRFWQKLLNTKYNRDAGKADVVVALTNGDASEWRKFAHRVEVIPNMVHLNDTGRYSSCQSKKAIFVGRYSTQKDIGSLIRIWQLVYQRHPEWELHVYGGYGNQPDKWQEIIPQTNANIFAHEATSEINEKYLESSMLLLTSVHEPFGLVLPEAMSCGLPVVSFDCPYGPADIISDGVDGFLVKDRNIRVFADRVCLLIENEELRVRMGREGIASSQRYKTGVIMPLWNSLFERLLHE